MRGVSGRLGVMDLPVDLATLSPDQLRTLAVQLAVQLADKEREVGEKERELQYRQPTSTSSRMSSQSSKGNSSASEASNSIRNR